LSQETRIERGQALRQIVYSETPIDSPAQLSQHQSAADYVRVQITRQYVQKCHTRWNIERLAKRYLDVTLALLILVLLSPFLLTIAALIKLTSSGPVLFKQQRYGISGSTFEILKFRTMRIDACDLTGIQQVSDGDRRVTRLGRTLRRSSIDELPQLINVLRGDMSLVGPRPHVPGMLAGGKLYEELVPEYFDRLRVLPGITGLAQVNGLRGSTKDASFAQARIEADLAYIQHWSLALDLQILIKTALCEFLSGRGL
jgi:lipopolysaccharide/colanic/teichoic acid biosynthesis glycosyltransferase